MKTFHFKNRLFLSYAPVIAGIIVLFAVVLISVTSSLNRETEKLHQQELFESNLSQLEALINQASRLATQVAGNNELLNVFIPLDEKQNAAGGGKNYFDDQLMDTIRIDSLLAGINGVDGFADRISVFNRHGDYVSTGRLFETQERIAQTLADVDALDALTQELQDNPAGFLATGFCEDSWSNNPGAQLFSLYRTLSYTETSTPYGLVAIQFQAARVQKLGFWADEMPGEYFLINDRDAQNPVLMYPAQVSFPLSGAYGQIRAHLDAQSGAGKPTVLLSYEHDRREELLLVSRVTQSDWILCRTLPGSALTLPYRNSYMIMILGCVALLALFLFIVNYMAVRISRPLRMLSSSIKGINLQNMRLDAGQQRFGYTTQELIALDEAFRAMLARLDKSIVLEMQAYMRVLQSQMNPHFLYNTLSIIIGSSEAAGDDRTVAKCLKLTAMLRYVADFKRESVPLGEELEHARLYLALMKDRYEELFTYEIEADEPTLAVMVPRLTVQPLAENCFVHGFTNEPPWHIHIRVQAEGARWRLTVEDNGAGMTEADIQALYARMEKYRHDVAGNYQELSLGGMGLINTLLRLTLTCGDQVQFDIASRPEGGLRVTIGGAMQ